MAVCNHKKKRARAVPVHSFLLFRYRLLGFSQKSDKEVRKIDRNANDARLRLFGAKRIWLLI